MRHLAPILEKLAKAQTGFLRAADAIACDQWKHRPGENHWSAAEIVSHLISVERTIVGGADRITQKPPQPVPFWRRMHFPLWLVEARVIKRKSPLLMDGTLVCGKEEMLGELRATRETTLAFLQETGSRDLRKYCWPHPFVGMLNLYEWFEMIDRGAPNAAYQTDGRNSRVPSKTGRNFAKLVHFCTACLSTLTDRFHGAVFEKSRNPIKNRRNPKVLEREFTVV